MDPDSGEICLASALDHEQEAAYDLTVVAVDRVSTIQFMLHRERDPWQDTFGKSIIVMCIE